MLLELNRDNYEKEISKSDIPVLVDIWGPRCIPCLTLNPMVEKLGIDYEGRIKVGKLDATKNRMLCAKMQVMSMPTFLIYKNGKEVKRLTGDDLTIKEIIEAVDQVID